MVSVTNRRSMVTLSQQEYEAILKIAKQQDRSISKIIAFAVRDYIHRYNLKEGRVVCERFDN